MNNNVQSRPESDRIVIGIDVSTGSARAGIFDMNGKMLASAKHDITLYRDSAHFVEQSSREIWNAVCCCGSQSTGKRKRHIPASFFSRYGHGKNTIRISGGRTDRGYSCRP
ncbi:hypothetical protein FE393_15450 [Xenorhabdus sp. psl]|nr:hypothetical protein [Xenorhabdus sp. psl]